MGSTKDRTVKFEQSLKFSLNETGVSSSSVLRKTFDSLLHVPATIVLKAYVTLGPKTSEGQLIEAVKTPWYEIVRRLEENPRFLYEIEWRQLEEIIAGAYKHQGCPHVILTPRSGDDGRDIIATWPGHGSIRIVDQVKAYAPGRLIKPDEVRSMLGVLDCDRNISKGIITTTSGFAPSIFKNPKFEQFIPYRLELKDGSKLVEWLKTGVNI